MPTPRRGRAFWSPLIAAYESSPVPQEEFAEAHGVHIATFRSWLHRLRREGTSRTATAPVAKPAPAAARFVELKPRPTGRPCVVRVGDAEIEFTEMPSAAYLADLLRVVAS